MIISKNLKKFNSIKHGFFNRKGGVSLGIYKSLNCGIGSKDKKSNVLKNLKIICEKIGCSKKKLILLNQTHSSKFRFIDKDYKFNNKRIKADALITDVKNVAISILTADCAPILFYDSQREIIGAVHAGWKGAYKKIIPKIIKYLLKKGSNLKNLHFVIGPAISKKNYEVGTEFEKKFYKQDKKNSKYFTNIKNRIFFSLNDYIKGQLENLGIINIEIIKKDTYNRKNNFFSYRRSKKNNHDYGRNISVIMIK